MQFLPLFWHWAVSSLHSLWVNLQPSLQLAEPLRQVGVVEVSTSIGVLHDRECGPDSLTHKSEMKGSRTRTTQVNPRSPLQVLRFLEIELSLKRVVSAAVPQG